MRKTLLCLWSAVLAAGLLAGCKSTLNLSPVITRIDANVDCGVAPTPVQFVAYVSGGDREQDPTGANTNLNVEWNFQDGNSGSGSVITHTYEYPGIYNVAATVTDNDGNGKTAFVTVTILADSLFVDAAPDTSVVASRRYFEDYTIGSSNGGPAGESYSTRPVINEVLMFNDSIPDPSAPPSVRYPVMELYNPSPTDTFQLNNWSLTDDLYYPKKFVFENGRRILPGQFITIWLDKKGETPGYDHTNFNPLEGYTGTPEDFVGVLYLIDNQTVPVDEVRIMNSRLGVSFGYYPDGCNDGRVDFRVVPHSCGFEPSLGQFERFDFTWHVGGVLARTYHIRKPSHTFAVEDAGTQSVIVDVFDTYTSVTRHDTLTVDVIAPAR